MRIAAIVPHILPFGGVRRFLEVGNVLSGRGYDYMVFVKNMEPHGKPVEPWMNYAGKMVSWEKAKYKIEADIVLIGDPPSFPILDEDPSVRVSGKVYIWVIAAGVYLEGYKKYEAKGYSMMLNNRVYSKDFPSARLCEGGVNTHVFSPKTVRVGYYAGRGHHKGEQHIVSSLKDLYNVVPVAIQGLKTPDLVKAYKSLDYFVCSENRPGWPNTAAEALACGVPVVSDSLNTSPFSDRVINVKDLREFFKNPMGDFSWERTCDRLEEIWREDGILDG
jgi:glycosyltransferase involved in cell wall biosynthesis